MEEIEDIIREAKWCLNCKTKPCSKQGCPMQTNIPEFIEEIKNNNIEKAYDILHGNNIFSHICSIVCPQEEQCEGSCIRAVKQTATNIGKLEKFVNEWAIKNSYNGKLELKDKNGKKIAIIGSGPAGLECALELIKEGFEVTIFEKDKIPGGILIYGIPDFRLDKKIVNKIIDNLKQSGVKFETEKELGKDIHIKDLKEKYDAVFIGIGATVSTTYKLSEKDNKNVFKSDDFLKEYNEGRKIENLGTAIVIGGGNVAMDSARAAIRMGAEKVKILYRRDRKHMPAREIELEEAIEDGVEFKELTRVISLNTENDKMVSVNCIGTEIIDGKAVDVDGKEFKEEANSVIFAIGLKPNKDIIALEGIELDDWNYIKIDEDGKTNLENVYAGGDCTESKSTVCRALAAGKKAALGIIKNIM